VRSRITAATAGSRMLP